MTALPTSASDMKGPMMASQQQGEEAVLVRRPHQGALRGFLAVLALAALTYYSFFLAPTRTALMPHNGGSADHVEVQLVERPRVPLEAHIMSKCPDALDCLKILILPTMQMVVDKVNFTLSFIGTPTDNDGVDCQHGPGECMGNIIELCAAKLYPSPKDYLPFTFCLTKDFGDIPQQSLVEDCALEHALDFQKLHECAKEGDGGTGMAMLRDSVRRSTEAGVTTSCTVRLNETIYCIRDDGKWKDCPAGPGFNDLVVAIEKQYQSSGERRSPSRAR